MARKRNRTAGSAIIPLRMPENMQERIRSLSTKERLSDADIMRMALERGLSLVEKMFAPPKEKAA